LALRHLTFIGAFGMTEHTVNAFREGAVDYTAKPFQVDEIAQCKHVEERFIISLIES